MNAAQGRAAEAWVWRKLEAAGWKLRRPHQRPGQPAYDLHGTSPRGDEWAIEVKQHRAYLSAIPRAMEQLDTAAPHVDRRLTIVIAPGLHQPRAYMVVRFPDGAQHL